MPAIVLKYQKNQLKEFPVIIGQNCSIGRKNGNDIVIDSLAVSGFHAQIDSVSTTFVLRDLDSTNGTFVNNKKVSMHNLQHNDVILIGKHELRFDCSDILKMKAYKSDLYEDAQTQVIDTKELRAVTANKEKENSSKHLVEVEPDEMGTKELPSLLTRIIKKIFG